MNNVEGVEDIAVRALRSTITSEVSRKFLKNQFRNSFSFIESESDLNKGTVSRLASTLH